MAAAPPVDPVQWTEDPETEDFNPGTSQGQKIFTNRSRAHPDGKLFTDSFEDAMSFQVFLRSRANSLGPCVTHIPVAWDATGTPTEFKNIITQYQTIALEHVQRAAFKRHGTALAIGNPIPPTPWPVMDITPSTDNAHQAIFYDRVKGNVVNKFLDNVTDISTLDTIRLEADKFTFTAADGTIKEDGPTKLFLLLNKQDPSTLINIEIHKAAIESATLQQFGNNVNDLIASIQKHHKVIMDNGTEYDPVTYRRHCFKALLSGANDEFNKKIRLIKSEVEAGFGFHKDISAKELLIAAQTFYTNLCASKEWDFVDPKDARILTLTSRLETLESKLSSQNQVQTQPATLATNSNAANPNDTGFIDRVAIWRTKFVGNTITRDGTTWQWCTHHKQPGKWDGLYWRDHDSKSHDEWKKQRKANQGKGKGSASEPKKDEQKQLQISDKLRTALATNLCVSEEDIDKIIKQQSGN
jgi:hypothetical protein